jgi:hypothetical protein
MKVRGRTVVLVSLLCLAGSTCLPGLGADVETRRGSVLTGLKELEKRVTYTETKIPLGELVQRVSQATGVTLRATRDVADEPIAVVVKELPARDLLTSLAELLHYRWSRRLTLRGWAYEIWQDLASKREEEMLRQAAYLDALKDLQRDVARVSSMASLSQKQIRDTLLEFANYQRELVKLTPEQMEQRVGHPVSAENRTLFERAQYASQLWSPINRAVASLLGHLTSEHWVLLRQRGQLGFSTHPGPDELPLPAETLQGFRAGQPGQAPAELHARPLPSEIAEASAESDREARAQWARAAGYRVVLYLVADRTTGRVQGLDAETEALWGGRSERSEFQHPAARLSLRPASDRQTKEASETVQRRRLILKDPVLGKKRDIRKLLRKWVSPVGEVVDRPRRFAELLPDLAQLYDAEFIADAYSYPPFPQLLELLEGWPKDVALADFLALGGRWERRGDLFSLRARDWFIARPREVPLRLVRRWRSLVEAGGALPLQEYLTIASLLSDTQLEGLRDAVQCGLLPDELADAREGRYALRIYASLDPRQRQWLWQGRALPVAAMRPQERSCFAEAVKDWYDDHRRPSRSQPRLDTAQLALKSSPSELVRGSGRNKRRVPVLVVALQLRVSPQMQESVDVTVASPTPPRPPRSQRR